MQEPTIPAPEKMMEIMDEVGDVIQNGGNMLISPGLPNYGLRIRPYTSKTIRGECRNEDCDNLRRPGSKFCQECSDKFKK